MNPDMLSDLGAALAEYIKVQEAAREGSGPPVLHSAPGSRLDQLTAEFARLAPQVKAVTERLKEIKDAIKIEALMGMPGVGATDAVVLVTPSLSRPLKLNSYPRTTVNSKTLKAAHPTIFAEHSHTTTVWTLGEVSGG